MSESSALSEALWQRCTPTYAKSLPVLDFPCETLPVIYAPNRTVLRFRHKARLFTFQWCYLRRKGEGVGVIKSFDISSLSEVRVKGMSQAIERLSLWFRFKNSRPRSTKRALENLGALLSWADNPQHAGRFEAVLSDSNIALAALKGYHTYLRNRLQNHLLTHLTAGQREQDAISCLSEIHGVTFIDHIEPLQATSGKGTEAPDSHSVGELSSTLQAIFDSAADCVLGDRPGAPERMLRISAVDDSKTVKLRPKYGPLRLMELACVAFAGLVIADTGANLAVIQEYEEPEDLEEQLANPDRINLTQKAVKFRAGGKKVEVHLSATTMTRLKTYLQVRQKLVTSLDCDDIGPLFIQCSYDRGNSRREPTNICALNNNFLHLLRRKVKRIGARLPNVTLRQLRSYKQQELVRTAPVTVAAKAMNHSVKTAIKSYCQAMEATRQAELAEFLSSLHKTVLENSEGLSKKSNTKVIPIGMCEDHENPTPAASSLVVEPDCSKVEGCFFCDKYHIHANEEDMRKLMSCRRVLKYIVPMNRDSLSAERIYTAVVDRIDALLEELKRRQPQTFESVRLDVEERGQITRFWANKLQQLHLLGMLPATPA